MALTEDKASGSGDENLESPGEKNKERSHWMKCSLDFDPGRGTIDAIFIVRQMQKSFWQRKGVIDRLLWIWRRLSIECREGVWWALRVVGVDEWIDKAIPGYMRWCNSAVRLRDGESKEF